MAAESVGQIGLDLVVNQEKFKKQMSGIQNLAKKTGAALASAFAVKKVVQFGKECIELGSDLQEVQNVVDVTFPNMTAKVNEFAQGAASAFGLSETMAKQYTGTFGAMAKAFGFSEKAAFDMGSSLTELAGDVASFYNLSQDEAYTKLKSVFTGETESLKELGVVMTQTALDQYALANGFGKTTSAMSEQEKVALRYAFVQSQLSAAAGDFERTSGNWANQVKVLNLQIESLKASLGQGFINLFTPVLQVINKVIAKLVSLANAFKAFTELITGGSSSSASGSTAAESLDSATSSAENLTDATNAAGDAASATAKKMKELMGFDSINKLSDNSDSASGSSGSSGGTSASTFDFGTLETGETVLDEVESGFQKIIDRFRELQALFTEGFNFGLGDTSGLLNIEESLASIKQSFSDIFENSKLISAAENWANSLAYNIGAVAGSFANIGITIGENLLGGLSQFLEKNKSRITEYLVSMFDIGADINDMVGNVTASIANIFSAFSSDDAKNITTNLIQFFSDGFTGITELAANLGSDILELITKPIVDNQEKFKEAIKNTLSPLSSASDTVAEAWRLMWDNVQQVYDDHVKPLIDGVTEGVSKIVGALTDGYNKYIAPVLNLLADKFDEVFEGSIAPAIKSASNAMGAVADLLSTIWKNILEPLFTWIADKIMPILSPIVALIGGAFLMAVEGISQKFTQFFDAIKDVAEELKTFIEGVSEAVEKIKKFPSKVTTTISGIKDKTWDTITAAWESIKNSTVVKTASGKIAAAFSTAKTTWESLKNSTVAKTLNAKTSSAFTKFKTMWDSLKDKTLSIKANVSAAITNIKNLINEKIIAKLNTAIKTLNKLPGVNVPKIPKLAQGGYVKRNTPQLAIIGDNMRQGEVVAPEDKLLAMAREAAAMSGGANSAEIVALLKQILSILQTLNLVASIDVDGLKKLIVRLINENTKATGVCELII